MLNQKLNPNRPSEPLRFCLLVEHLSCFILEGIAGHVERIRQTRCSTSKRKTNRKQWKQPKIIDKRHNERLGLKQSTNCTLQNNSLHLHMRINLTSPILGKVKPEQALAPRHVPMPNVCCINDLFAHKRPCLLPENPSQTSTNDNHNQL